MKQFRSGMMAALACALVITPAAAQDSASVSVPTPGYPRLTKLAPNVYGYEEMQKLDRGAFSTGVLFVVTNDGVMVVDGMANPTATKEVVDAIARVTPKPIRWVMIGSDHSDHTGGNSAYPAGVTYYVTPISKATLEKAQASPRFKADAWKLPADAVVVDDRKTVDLGGYVFPAMRSASPTKWVETAKKALALKNVTTYVPAHGEIVAGAASRENFEKFVKAMEEVIANVTALHAKGLTVDQALAQVDWGPYASWPMAKEQGQIAVRRIYMELNGELK